MELEVVLPGPAATTLVPLRGSRRRMTAPLMMVGYSRNPRWRVRTVSSAPRMLVVKIVLGFPLMLLEVGHLRVQLCLGLAAVVLETHHWVQTAYSGDRERCEQENAAPITLLGVQSVVE